MPIYTTDFVVSGPPKRMDGTTSTTLLRGDGGGGGGSPGGANTQIQFNSTGSFAGDANLTWDGSYFSSTALGFSVYAPGGFVQFGDINGDVNATNVLVDDASATISIQAGAIGFVLDGTNLYTSSSHKHRSFGDLIVDDASLGLVLKSASGHYWRVSVSNLGVLSTADLGTSLP